MRPQFVLAKDAAANRIVVGPREQLAIETVTVSPAKLYRDGSRVDRVKLRYRSEPVPCSLAQPAAAGAHAALELELHEQVHGAAAGQTACLLEGDRVLGFGTIAASGGRVAA
jgi:tRNA-specific 2-thiouridylase